MFLVILLVPLSQPTYQPVPTPLGQVLTTIIILDYGKEFFNLVKIYIEESKYNRENNSFIFKLAIFNNICSKADILFEICIKVFPTILKGLILDYYY